MNDFIECWLYWMNDFFEWIFLILFWIEYWTELFFSPIAWKKLYLKRIHQGYTMMVSSMVLQKADIH